MLLDQATPTGLPEVQVWLPEVGSTTAGARLARPNELAGAVEVAVQVDRSLGAATQGKVPVLV